MCSGSPHNISYLCTVRHIDVLTIGEEAMLRSIINLRAFIPFPLVMCLSIAIILVPVIGAVRSGGRGFAILEISSVGKADPEGSLLSTQTNA